MKRANNSCHSLPAKVTVVSIRFYAHNSFSWCARDSWPKLFDITSRIKSHFITNISFCLFNICKLMMVHVTEGRGGGTFYLMNTSPGFVKCYIRKSSLKETSHKVLVSIPQPIRFSEGVVFVEPDSFNFLRFTRKGQVQTLLLKIRSFGRMRTVLCHEIAADNLDGDVDTISAEVFSIYCQRRYHGKSI